MAKTQIRIDADALAEWKRTVGIPLDDGAAANAAVRLASTHREREAGCIAHGARWLLQLLRSGYVEVDGCEVHVEGNLVEIGHPNGRTARLGWGGSRVEVEVEKGDASRD